VLPRCVPWPEELATRYRREGYWTGEALGDLLQAWAPAEPERVALVGGERRWTYGELDAAADRFAAGLWRLGVRSLDRVVVQLPNVPEFVIISIALFRLGALPVFALPAHRRAEIAYLCAHSQAVAYIIPAVFQGFDYRTIAAEVSMAAQAPRHVIVVGDPGRFIPFDGVDANPIALRRPDPAEIALFLLSGGTTGMPKLIPRTHDDYAYQLRATARALDFGRDGVYLACQPAAHNAALGCPGVLGALRAGGKVVLAFSPSPDEVFPLVEREGVTLTTLMPTFLQLWIETAGLFEADLRRTVLQVGSAKLNPAVAQKVRPVLGCTLTHWFGMAEGFLAYTRLDEPDEVAALTQGRPLCPADELRVVDEFDNDVPAGKPGELLVRGPYTLRGYYGADDHNARAFTSDGYLRTGDLISITADNNMVVEGRLKDVIHRGGDKVPAGEIEDHLIAHPNVHEAAVVAVPDERLGERTCAFVIPEGAAPTLAELRTCLADRGLADYKLPDRLELADSFPRTGFGKVSKAELRATCR
jgi:2,3-dihydroxybenzoate-AMP ligase